jgi:hypothetical protein
MTNPNGTVLGCKYSLWRVDAAHIGVIMVLTAPGTTVGDQTDINNLLASVQITGAP